MKILTAYALRRLNLVPEKRKLSLCNLYYLLINGDSAVVVGSCLHSSTMYMCTAVVSTYLQYTYHETCT